ncbi:MAG: immunoglobulin domain-containing protein [Verrucomicrobia bacterium]|nr:immunoglobulin domain-containing protein [Verrucomicrobiota bacterium]
MATVVFTLFASVLAFETFAAKGPQPTICNRACWGARDTSCSSTISTLNRAIIHHTAGSEFATTGLESSKNYMRNNQNYHMDTRGFCDVGYHFMVDKFGNIFEARKNSMAGLPRGAHDGNNFNSFGFTLMGWFHPDKPGGANQPTAVMISALFDVIAWRMPSEWSPYGSGTYNGVTVGFLDGHRKVKATACPGDGIHGPYIGSNYNGGLARNGVYERKNPPIAPSALQATAVSKTQINLSWTDNSVVETGFKIERATASAGPWSQIATVGANVKTYSSTSLTMDTTYYYRVRAYGALGDSAYSNVANATTLGPGPTITSHPQTQTKDSGQNVTFQVTATGTGTLIYQWRKNGVNLVNGGRFSGVATATLIISALEATDVGAYTVRITDTAGAVTSAEAQLYLNAIVIFQDTFDSNLNGWTAFQSPATALTISSTNHTAVANSKSAQLSSSYDKMYRDFTPEIEGRARATFWMYDNMGGQTRWFGEVRSYAGAGYNSGALLQLCAIGRYGVGFGTGTGSLANEVVDSTKYQGRVVAGDNKGWFNLNATRTAGWHKFEIERNGTTVYFYVDGVLARTITSATYSPWDSVTIGSYGPFTHTAVTGNAWFDDIKLEYFNAPTILTQPAGLTRIAGANATFTVNATNNVEGYQWRFEGSNITGATNSSYTRSSVQASHEGAYSVVVRNRAGTVTSVNAALVVNVPPQITAQPEEGSVRTGNTAVYEVAASGTEPLSYQWFFNGANINGATESQLNLPNVTTNDGGSYSVRVTNVAGTVTSAVVTLSILPPQVLEMEAVQLTDGNLKFTLGGDSESEYFIQTSSNLVDWITITNIILTNSSAEFSAGVSNHPALFYRVYQEDID